MPKFISRSGQFPVGAGSSASFIDRGGKDSSLATKSTIDRVLILAAVICAAGLVWQLTVLLMGHGAAAHKAELAKSDTASPLAGAKPDPAGARVVYPVEANASAPKTTVKAADTPVAPASVSAAMPAPGAAAPAPGAGAAIPASQPPALPAGPQPSATPSAALDPAPAASPGPAAQPAAPSSPPASFASLGAPSPTEAVPPAPPVQATLSAEPPAPAAAKPKTASSGLLNINNASVEALNRLPGGGHIGGAIASHRPYKSVADLVKKRVLRREVFEQIKGQIATE